MNKVLKAGACVGVAGLLSCPVLATVRVPEALQDRQYIYCIDRESNSKETIQLGFRTERVNLFQVRVKDYQANANGERLLKLPRFRNQVASYLTSGRPSTPWAMKTALAAWKAWSSDPDYHTITLNGVHYICAVNVS